jgi:hypothetical protein
VFPFDRTQEEKNLSGFQEEYNKPGISYAQVNNGPKLNAKSPIQTKRKVKETNQYILLNKK